MSPRAIALIMSEPSTVDRESAKARIERSETSSLR
jgi:hypothetical protein